MFGGGVALEVGPASSCERAIWLGAEKVVHFSVADRASVVDLFAVHVGISEFCTMTPLMEFEIVALTFRVSIPVLCPVEIVFRKPAASRKTT